MSKILPILAFSLLVISCAQKLSFRSSIEIARERDWPVGIDGKKVPNNPDREREFKIFWSRFRKDVLSKNWAGLSERVVFPLKTRATLDSDPVINVEENEFQSVFASFLKGEDPSHFGESEETLIRELRAPNPYIVNDWVRIGDMQFTRKNDGWKLYWIYFDLASMHKRTNHEQDSSLKPPHVGTSAAEQSRVPGAPGE